MPRDGRRSKLLPAMCGRSGTRWACGVSANLCEALVRLIEPFPTLEVGVSWARTRPLTVPATVVRFGRADAALLREAARSLRDGAPQPDVRLYGFVRLPKGAGADNDGTIRLSTEIRRATAIGRRDSGARGPREGGSGSPRPGGGVAVRRSGPHWSTVVVAESAPLGRLPRRRAGAVGCARAAVGHCARCRRGNGIGGASTAIGCGVSATSANEQARRAVRPRSCDGLSWVVVGLAPCTCLPAC